MNTKRPVSMDEEEEMVDNPIEIEIPNIKKTTKKIKLRPKTKSEIFENYMEKTIHRLDKLIEIKAKESEEKLKIKEEQVQATRELNATIKEAVKVFKNKQ